MGHQQRSLESELRPANQGIIQCHCGACSLTVVDDRGKCFFMCGCSDCRQFAEYAHAQGGVKPVALPRLFYFRADIVSVDGREHLAAFKLRKDGYSTRLCCRRCFSILAVDHPGYWGNVMLTLPDYCRHQCDLSQPLSAYLHMGEYRPHTDHRSDDVEHGNASNADTANGEATGIEDDDWEPYVPLFESFRYRRQRMQYNMLADRVSWKEAFVPQGVRLNELIKQLDNTEILGLKTHNESMLDLQLQNADLNREIRSLKDQIILWREMGETSDDNKRRVQLEMIQLGDKLKRYEQEFGSLYYQKPV